jgi:hypothetical protein
VKWLNDWILKKKKKKEIKLNFEKKKNFFKIGPANYTGREKGTSFLWTVFLNMITHFLGFLILKKKENFLSHEESRHFLEGISSEKQIK